MSPFDFTRHETQFLRVKKQVFDSVPVLGHLSLSLALFAFLHMISSESQVLYVPVYDSLVDSQVA